MTVPTPAHAVVDCVGDVGPISHLGETEPIVCVNTEARTNAAGNAIELSTDTNAGSYIDLDSSGVLIADDATAAYGIFTRTYTADSFITIVNSDDIWATGGDGGAMGGRARGIDAYTDGNNSRISIVNSGDIWATGGDGGTSSGAARGIDAYTASVNSRISIVNSGDIWAVRSTCRSSAVFNSWTAST